MKTPKNLLTPEELKATKEQLKAAKKAQKDSWKAESAAERLIDKLESKLEKHDDAEELAEDKAKEQAIKDWNSSTSKFTMYKKCYFKRSTTNKLGKPTEKTEHYIVTLAVSDNTKRVMCLSEIYNDKNRRKIRVAQAIVTDIQRLNPKTHKLTKANSKIQVFSAYDNSFTYTKGQCVKPTNRFSTNPHEQCSSGIHGYLSIERAMEH